jgi:4-methylaminobutanoate oxidase (formaldehyde-forming)
MTKQLPKHSQVVIIGGGIIGCSVAYHLTKHGWKDVVLLERKMLTSGTTWAAAGLIAQMRATEALTKLAKYSIDLYSRLEKETGQATGFISSGSILLARTEGRVHEYARGAAMARSFGIEMEKISFEEARKFWPIMSTEKLTVAYHVPQDAIVNPVDTAQALAKGARMGGAKIFERVKVTDVYINNGKVTGVRTDQGDIVCEYVVNCAGMWARELGKKVGVSLPLYAAEHMHIVTKPIEGLYKGMPFLRDYDAQIYFREEVGGLLMGGFEPIAKPWGMKGIPENFEFTELNEDWDQFGVFTEKAVERCPALGEVKVRHLTVVPESFTPDNAYMLGEAPGVKNYFVAAGMNSVGVASAGGVGKALAEWVVDGAPAEDLWTVDVRRCSSWEINAQFLQDRTVETVGNLLAAHWPFKQPWTARPVRCSPYHDRLVKLGACFGVGGGWERPNWFAPGGVAPKYEYSWGRQNWFEYSAQEHMAMREGVGVYDLTCEAKFLLQGRDAEKVLQYICANNIARPVGKVVYTQLLNEKGGIEADLTVTRLAQETFLIVTGASTKTRDFDWIKRHIPDKAHAFLTNITSGYAMLAIMGPKSRDLLSRLSDADLSNEVFPFATAQRIDVAYARPLALRISYVGELGWELYIPVDFATGVFDALVEEGKNFDLKWIGLHALDSLRMEKGFREWGSDLRPDFTPYESALAHTVKLEKEDFLGRQALVRQLEDGLTRKLVTFALEDPEPLLYKGEPIYRNEKIVGYLTHGAYGHFIGTAVGMGYVENPDGIDDEWIASGNYEIDVEGKRIPARVYLTAPYDPQGQRVRM